MAKIKFLTDTASDLPGSLGEKYDIEMMPIAIVVDGQDYINKQNDDFKSFYNILRSCKELPKTSQITTYQFIEQYKKIFDEGYTHVIGLFLPSFASGTYQNACLAIEQFKETYPEAKDFEIFITDSNTYSLGYGLGLVEAAKRYEAGADFKELVAFIKDWTNEMEIYFCMHTLEFAKRSGRLSGMAALVGDVLGIKPIMSVKDGKPSVYKKIRGKKAIVRELAKIAEERMDECSIYAVLQGETEEEARALCNAVKDHCGYDSYGAFYSGPAVTINSGPEIVGIGFRSTKK